VREYYIDAPAGISHYPIGLDGAPLELRMQWMRRSLEAIAQRILDRSRHRAPSILRPIWIEVAVEMVLRRYGLGRVEWEGIPQRSLLRDLLVRRVDLPGPTGFDGQDCDPGVSERWRNRQSDLPRSSAATDPEDAQAQRGSRVGVDGAPCSVETTSATDPASMSLEKQDGQVTFLVRRLRDKWGA
jgi:hypothetical protein